MMAVPPLEQRLDLMAASPDAGAVEPVQPAMPMQEDMQAEDVQVAGLGLKVLQGLTRKGARAEKAPKLVDNILNQPAPQGATKPVATPVAPVTTPKPAATVTITKPRPVDVTEMNQIAAEREFLAAEGAGQARPPDTPISSAWTDNDGLAATIRAAGDNMAQQAPTMTMRSAYTQAINAGIPEQFLKRVLAGESMESTVGGSALTRQLAGAVVVHDESAKKLDDLFSKMASGALDDQGKLNLRLQLAQHKIIVDQLKGIQTDVARSLNVFKRVKDRGPGLDTRDIRAALDELGANQSDQVLFQLAEDYLQTPTRAGKNRIIEAGFGAKLRDVWFHTYQANLLNDPQTHAYNLVGSGVFGSLMPVERSLAVGIGRVRSLIPGANPDRYMLDDIQAGLSGLKNGILDGWELAKEAIKKGGESKMSESGRVLNPVSAEYLSDTPIKMFGQEVYRTPDLRDTWMGRAIDGLGFVQDIMSFKPIAAADEFVGAMVGRYQLHEEAWRFANKEYDRLVAEGMSDVAARAEVEAKVTQLLVERPRSMQENIEGVRRMVTLQEKISKEGMLGETYWWSNQVLNLAPVKVIVPFARTITNLFIEGSSYIPVLNTVSPRFYDLWQKGGRHRDVAIARLSMGGTAIFGASMLTFDNRITGSGPSQTEDRKALEALGWQPYSLVFDKGEISEENIERLRAITKVAVGPDKVYVSYARFDPISMVFSMGADMADAAKFDRRPDREDWQVMAMAGATAVGEYMSNLPVMQGIGELLQVARSRMQDTGEKMVQIFDALAKQYTNFVYTGTPGVGISNSTLMAHIERLVNPTRSNVKSPEMDTPYGIRAFYETRQRILSRIPGLSENVPPLLDNLGRESVVRNRGLDYWANWSPIIQATEGRSSEADEILASINFGIANPSETWDGVRLSASQINRFKKLYGQEILEEMTDYVIDPKTGKPVIDKETGQPKTKIVMANLEQAIPIAIRQAEIDASALGDIMLPGDKQKLISGLVERYRSMAKMQMVGNVADPLGLDDGVVEFPDLAAAMRKNKELTRIFGR